MERTVTTDTSPVSAEDVKRPTAVPDVRPSRAWLHGFAVVAALGAFLAGVAAFVLAVRGL